MSTKQEEIEKVQRLREAFFKYASHSQECKNRNSSNLDNNYLCICGYEDDFKRILADLKTESFNHRTGHNAECQCNKCLQPKDDSVLCDETWETVQDAVLFGKIFDEVEKSS